MSTFRMFVLIVEDDKDQAATLAVRLSNINDRYDVVCLFARTLKRAVEIIKSDPLDLVLLDLELTDSSREQTFNRIKHICDAPIAVITGYPDMKAHVIEQGAIDCMIKPNDISDTALMSILYKAIEAKEIALPEDRVERKSMTRGVWDSI